MSDSRRSERRHSTEYTNTQAHTSRLTLAQVDLLGERLRTSDTVSETDLDLLQRYQAEHAAALAYVQARIDDVLPGVSQTSRIKTIGTLHDKLRRQPTRLSQVQDIAGVRIVRDMNRVEQNRIVEELRQAFVGSRVVDRRARPTYGYRAVHVIVRHGRCNVEIQVRTHMQSLWADVVERLADRWGRQIRYGGLPDEPGRPIGGAMTRGGLWAIVLTLADAIASVETGTASRQLARTAGLAPDSTVARDLNVAEQQVRQTLALLQELVATAAL